MKKQWSVRTRIVLVCLIVIGLAGIFLWPVPQIQQAAKDARSAEIVDPIVNALENPSEMPAGYWVTLLSGTEIRACADMKSNVIGGKFPDEPVKVTGKAFEGADEILWLRVTDPAGTEGWIPADAARNSNGIIPTQEELGMKFAFDFASGKCSDADFEAAPVATDAPAATEAPEDKLPAGVLPAVGADLRASADMNSEILGMAQSNPLEVLGKDSKNPDTADDDWIYVRDGNDLEGWIPMKAVVVNQVELDLSKVPDKDGSQPVIAEEPNTESAAPEAQADVVTYTPVGNAVPLISKEETIGFFWVLNQVGPTTVVSPYQSTTLFALGNGTVGNTKVSSDGTEGNVVTLLCNEPDGCETEVKDYTPGHVGITMILAGKEVPAETALGAVVNLFNAPNCGGSGCPTNHHYQSGKQETFTTQPSAVKLDVPWVSITTTTAIVGEPPANARVIKINKKVVGHAYTCSGECSVSVPEGAGGTVACFPEGGTADGKAVNSGEIVSWNSADSDGGTPEDLNNTVLLNGNNIQITMIYMADLEPFMNVACGQ